MDRRPQAEDLEVADILLVSFREILDRLVAFPLLDVDLRPLQQGSGGVGHLFLQLAVRGQRLVELFHLGEDQRLGFVGAGIVGIQGNGLVEIGQGIFAFPHRGEQPPPVEEDAGIFAGEADGLVHVGEAFFQVLLERRPQHQGLGLQRRVVAGRIDRLACRFLGAFHVALRQEIQLDHEHQRLRLLGIELESFSRSARASWRICGQRGSGGLVLKIATA